MTLVLVAAVAGQLVLLLDLQSGQMFAAPEMFAGGSHCPVHLVGSTVLAGSAQPDLVPTFASVTDLEVACSTKDFAVAVADQIFHLLSEVLVLQAAEHKGQLAVVLAFEAGYHTDPEVEGL